jgi:hypothetical protein
MAITFNNIDGMKAVATIDPGHAEQLKHHGVTVEVGPAQVKLRKGLEILAGFACKPALIQAVIDGKAPATKTALKNAVRQALKMLAGEAAPAPTGEAPKALAGEGAASHKASTLDKLMAAAKPDAAPAPLAPSPPPAADSVPVAGPYPLDKLVSGERVKLLDATMLYQPVYGSSGGSRYHVVAIADGLKIAAKWKPGGPLSVRAEGPKLAAYAARLAQAELGDNQHYWSNHLAVGNDAVLASRTLGSILGSVDAEWLTPAPKLAIIAGKGI